MNSGLTFVFHKLFLIQEYHKIGLFGWSFLKDFFLGYAGNSEPSKIVNTISLFPEENRRLEMPDSEIHFFPTYYEYEEGEKYLKNILLETNWRQDKINIYGKIHNVPRLTAWYGDEGKSYTYSGIAMMKGVTQKFWEHSIPKSTKNTEPRINLTFRYII